MRLFAVIVKRQISDARYGRYSERAETRRRDVSAIDNRDLRKGG